MVTTGMQTKRRVFKVQLLLFFVFLLCCFSSSAFARMVSIDTPRTSFSALAKITALPNLEQCMHKTGRLWFTVTNYGVLGNQRDYFFRDCLTGGFTSSAEFPGGSGVEYLFQGALWVGGIVGEDTLTSIGTDGWVNIREIFPDAGAKGSFIRRSARKDSPFYSPEAVSDLDLIAVYYDTLKDPRLVTNPDPADGKPHKPMGLRIEQRSYSWGASWGQDWVLLDYNITNLGNEAVKKSYVGLFLDPDIGNVNSGRATHSDDYCGFQRLTLIDTCIENIENLNIAYAYDNDGDPEPGSDFGLSSKSPVGAFGVRVLRAGQALRPDGTLAARQSFNWWIADSTQILDWGPQKAPGRINIYNGRGEPTGDRMRYAYLVNREIDYDQVMSAFSDPSALDTLIESGWLPPMQPLISAFDVANGADSRFLVSVGPFDLDPGESVPITFGLFTAPSFHRDPENFTLSFPTVTDFQKAANILSYKSKLDFGGLVANGRMVRKIFDNDTENFLAFCSFFLTLGKGHLNVFSCAVSMATGCRISRGRYRRLFRKWSFPPAKGR